jgi:hypothetical protein
MRVSSIIAFLILVHGIIHLVGFTNAFGRNSIFSLMKAGSKSQGILWLLAASLFIASAILLFFSNGKWWIIGFPATLLSQFLIITDWTHARYGTAANVVVFIACMLSLTYSRFEKHFEREVAEAEGAQQRMGMESINEKDMARLPPPVQRYLRYTGALHNRKISGYKISFKGQMREKGKDWFDFTSEQYNFTTYPARLFFMKAAMFGVTVPGYHTYINGHASMKIKLFGLFPIIDEKEGILNKAETVTLFNDMCIFAPGSLIDERITWERLTDLSARAVFTVNKVSITATLYFNDRDQLVNFESDDRYAMGDKKQYRFSTPVKQYRDFNGHRLAGYGEAVWHYPDGRFVYGKFTTQEVRYIY